MGVSVGGIEIPDGDSYYDRIRGESSLVMYCPLQEDVTNDRRVLDVHGGRIGTVVSAPARTTGAGVPYGDVAMEFDGTDDYIEFPYEAALNTANWTVEFYVKWVAAGTYKPLVTSRVGSNGWIIGTGAGADHLSALMNGAWVDSTSPSLSTGQWYHVAVTYDGTSIRFYINGSLIKTTATAFTQNTTEEFRIARTDTGTISNNVQMAHLAVYNSALSVGRINAHMSAYANAVLQMGPVGYWRCNTLVGTVELDLSGNGYDGTITNTPTLGAAGALKDDVSASMSFAKASLEHISIPYDAALNPATFTLVAWHKTGTSGANAGIVSCIQLSTNLYGFGMLYDAGDDLRMIVGNGDAATVSNCEFEGSYADDVWRCGIGTYDGTDVLQTLNGVDGTAVTGSYGQNTAANLFIGRNANAAEYIDGEIQDVALFNRVLSDDEKAYLLDVGKAGLREVIK